MNTEKFERKLSAILSADVKGYSRLMRADEDETIRTVTAYRTAITKLVEQYRGRVVDSPGDNVLAEFGSGVDAVNCAVEVQRELAERNEELPAERKMEFRIGVNSGDVIQEGERIYGDGVNIAARVEGLAEGGGICISGTVYDSIESKLGLEFENLGKHEVKNIDKPIRVYRILSFPGAAAHRVVKAKKAVGKIWRKTALGVAALLVIAVGAWAIWNYGFRAVAPPEKVISKEPTPTQLPEKPTIAVLPFDNMSKDPDQEYFSDGLSEDLITDLSKISDLLVISRKASFFYKGKNVEPNQIAAKLGVRYIIEGSVRKAEDQVRINAQLIDATTGHHLWAERYDGRLNDIFSLQDKITQQIVTSLALKLTEDEQERLVSRDTNNIKAYDAFLKGLDLSERMRPDDFVKAIPYFEKAIELDPNYGRAYAALAEVYYYGRFFGLPRRLNISSRECGVRRFNYLQMAMKNPTNIAARTNAYKYLWQGQNEKAITEAERALVLDPNDVRSNRIMATALIAGGRPDEAVYFNKRALRVDPVCFS